MPRALLRALLLPMLLVPAALGAQSRVRTPQVEAMLVPEARSLRPGTPLRVALRLVVAPGWHIYWKNPGESGLPTTVQWKAPGGFRAGPTEWQYPERKDLSGVTVHAYEGEVVLLGEIHPPPDFSAGRAEIVARVSWGVCREVCIPQDAELSISLPVRDEAPRPHRRWGGLDAAAALRIPRALPGWNAAARRTGEGILLQVTAPGGRRLPEGTLTFFPDDPSIPAAVGLAGSAMGGQPLALHLALAAGSVDAPTRLRGVLVAHSGWDPEGRFRALRVDVSVGRRIDARN